MFLKVVYISAALLFLYQNSVPESINLTRVKLVINELISPNFNNVINHQTIGASSTKHVNDFNFEVIQH